MHFKRLKFDQSIKKTEAQKNRITDPLAFCQMFPKFMEDVYTSKYIPILTKYSLKINVVFVKALTHFSPVSHFYTLRKHQKTFGFLTFSGGTEM